MLLACRENRGCNCSPFVISFTEQIPVFLNAVRLCSKSRADLSSGNRKKKNPTCKMFIKKEKTLYT